MNWFLQKYYDWLPNRPKQAPEKEAKVGGVITSKTDTRDYVPHITGLALPSVFTLRPLCTLVESQGLWNSCVGEGITDAVEVHSKKNGYPFYYELSVMDVWNEARKLSGTYPNNLGCSIRDGWKAAKNGVTIEKLFPYAPESYNQTPGLAAKMFRQFHTPFNYYFIRSTMPGFVEQSIKEALFAGCLVVFGIPLMDDFFTPDPTKVYTPLSTHSVGGHCMRIVGWDDNKGAFEIRNSWGRSWGDNGYLFVNKEWLLKNAFDVSFCTEVSV